MHQVNSAIQEVGAVFVGWLEALDKMTSDHAALASLGLVMLILAVVIGKSIHPSPPSRDFRGTV